ncbi:MAG: methyltransferase domain-containing protein [Planctomycetota bacterium]|nr:methyltransferase domain-containing protein [Planctomycetota bacterium]
MRHQDSAAQSNESFHDRVARRYDEIYKGPRWDLWYELSWAPMKAWLPPDLRAPVVDLGCGTGKYGLRVAKTGYSVTLTDLSQRMLEVARRKAAELGLEDRVSFLKADIMDLSALPREHFALAMAQGDELSFASLPAKALQEIRKVLRPEGVLVASVDQTLAAIDHYAEKTDLAGLEKLLKSGEMEWLARDATERFPVHTFTAERLRDLCAVAGFEVLDLFGKTVLPLKKLEALLENEAAAQRIMALEKKLCRIPSAMGRTSHLQITARRMA